MAIDDFLTTMLEMGATNGRWKGPWALAGLVIGAGLGGYLAYTLGEGTVLGVASGIGTGAFLGWIGALMLRGFGIFLLIFFFVLAVTLGWQWLTGGA